MEHSTIIPESFAALRDRHVAKLETDDGPSLEMLEAQVVDFSQESLPIVFDDGELSNRLRANVGDFAKKVSRFFSNLFRKEGINVRLLDDRSLARKLASVDYAKVRDLKIVVPKGFTGPYNEYITTLGEFDQERVQSFEENVLDPYLDFLGTFLNDPEKLKSQRRSEILETLKAREIETYQESIGAFFSRDQAERRLYKELVRNQSQWKEILSGFNERVVSIQAIPRKRVEQKVTEISDLLETLGDRLDKDPELYNLSGVSAEDIMQASYAIAYETEFFAIYTYMLEELGGSIDFCTEYVLKKSK